MSRLRTIPHQQRTLYGGLALGVAATLLMLLVLQGLPWFARAEPGAYDFQLSRRANLPSSPDIVVVGVDQASVSFLQEGSGLYPLPRHWMTAAINKLHRAHAKAIVIDLLYDTESKDDPGLAAAMKRAGNVVVVDDLVALPESDSVRAQSILSKPVSRIAKAAARLGLANLPTDGDGVIRAVDLEQPDSGGQLYPSLAVQAASIVLHQPVSQIIRGLPRHMLINYVGAQNPGDTSQTFQTHSFVSVAQDEEPDSLFHNKIVLIGCADVICSDLHRVPYGDMYGTVVEANALNTILHRNPMQPAGDMANRIILLIMGLVTTLAVAFLGPWKSTAAALALALGYLVLSFVLFDAFRLWVDLIKPESIVVLVFAAVTPLNALEERSVRAELRSLSVNLQAVVKSAMDGIITVDNLGVVRSFNPAAERMFGYAAPEVVGQSVGQLVGGSQGGAGGAALFGLGPERRLAYPEREVQGRRKDGTTFPMELAVSEMHVDDEPMLVGIVRDITRRKQQQEELAEARDRALEANRTKSAFMANMSHELRTPLNAIIGYSELLMEDAADGGQQITIADLEKIRAAGRHLLDLINDVLDLSKVEAGKMALDLETFDVARLVQNVVSTIRPLVERNDNVLELKLDGDLGSMRADQTKVRQILFNLLSNAGKFTEHGTITLALSRHAQRVPGALGLPVERPPVRPPEDAGGRWISFGVTDTGIGIAPDQLEKLFQAFSQADVASRQRYGGTGLGLALSRHFARMMGGDIVVESRADKGSTFTLLLPVDVAGPQAEPQPPDTALAIQGPSGAHTVLVIDDDPDARDLLRRVLSKEGLRVESVADGKEGIQRARELQPDVITLDVLMPEMDGWAVLAALKDDPELADIPVIMLTVLDDQDRGYALGVSDYVMKPADPGHLAAVLNRYRRDAAAHPLLVVEDDTSTRRMLRRVLENQGWTVMEAENGRAALERIGETVPSLILLDLMMPEMGGFEFVGELHKREEWRSIPVVVITARDITAEDQARLDGFVAAILQKGAYSRDEFLAEVRRLVMASVRERLPHLSGSPDSVRPAKGPQPSAG